MAGNEGTVTGNGKGWTDRQRLAYYFNLVEHSNVKLDYANAPRPDGKSVGACQIMVHRLKGTLKAELAALRGVDEADVTGGGGGSKKPPTARKRKAKDAAAAEGEGERMPTKRGRKKKEVQKEEVVEEEVVEEEGAAVKPEPKDEDIDEHF